MRLYVGNFNYRTTERDLKELFSEFGKVTRVKIIFDKEKQQSKGYGFVEMPNESQASECIHNLDGMPFDGRTLRVKVAHASKRDGEKEEDSE
ncbi:RNA recognition motif domain-containing protein [Candidatus Riflebacteria bacterium]